ncbi:MAG: hypothetical protein RBS56_02950 [Candidatus Gracilibacteria bacterium]|jgi:hypothetical protein|nr:hypothetical protein [Candidatus Gracilibacteria bacterium]
MLNENLEKTIESQKKHFEISTETVPPIIDEKQFSKEKIFLSLYIVFSVLSAFLLGMMVEKFVFLEANKSPVYYSEFN